MVKFRFQDLEIWKMSIELVDKLFDIADDLENKKLYRFAEQIRGASMSISNNIAEGSGAGTKKDFRRYLSYARKSTFESANIVILLSRRNLVDRNQKKELLEFLDHL